MSELAMSNQTFEAYGELLELACSGNVSRLADLSKLSRWEIGGLCQLLVEPSTITELAAVIKIMYENQIPYIVVGDGSNLLFSSKGLNCVVLKVGKKLSDYRIEGTKAICQSGIWVPKLARNIAKAGLVGMQHTIGIPGTLGGLVCMNGGSQRRGIGENIKSVTAVSPCGEIEVFSRADCQFNYRESVFQVNRYVIAEVELEFSSGSYRESRAQMLGIMRSRRQRFPLKLPNCGSVFVSNPKMYEVIGPPGKAIEQVGLKGYKIGAAQFSPDHANFIVNNGNATSEDVLKLINLARTTVFNKTGYLMDTEVIFVSESGNLIKPHTLCDV